MAQPGVFGAGILLGAGVFSLMGLIASARRAHLKDATWRVSDAYSYHSNATFVPALHGKHRSGNARLKSLRAPLPVQCPRPMR